jgi:hypothetical protein
MKNTIKIILRELSCVKTNEKNGNEVFCQLRADYENETSFIAIDYPESKGFWSFMPGDVQSLNLELFTGLVGKGITISVTFKERDTDIHQLSSLLDDYLGAITIVKKSGAAVEVKNEKKTEIIYNETTAFWECTLLGSKAEYKAYLEIRE